MARQTLPPGTTTATHTYKDPGTYNVEISQIQGNEIVTATKRAIIGVGTQQLEVGLYRGRGDSSAPMLYMPSNPAHGVSHDATDYVNIVFSPGPITWPGLGPDATTWVAMGVMTAEEMAQMGVVAKRDGAGLAPLDPTSDPLVFEFHRNDPQPVDLGLYSDLDGTEAVWEGSYTWDIDDDGPAVDPPTDVEWAIYKMSADQTLYERVDAPFVVPDNDGWAPVLWPGTPPDSYDYNAGGGLETGSLSIGQAVAAGPWIAFDTALQGTQVMDLSDPNSIPEFYYPYPLTMLTANSGGLLANTIPGDYTFNMVLAHDQALTDRVVDINVSYTVTPTPITVDTRTVAFQRAEITIGNLNGDFDVDWGDGVVQSSVDLNYAFLHDYAAPGTYAVTVTGAKSGGTDVVVPAPELHVFVYDNDANANTYTRIDDQPQPVDVEYYGGTYLFLPWGSADPPPEDLLPNIWDGPPWGFNLGDIERFWPGAKVGYRKAPGPNRPTDMTTTPCAGNPTAGTRLWGYGWTYDRTPGFGNETSDANWLMTWVYGFYDAQGGVIAEAQVTTHAINTP